MQADIDTQDLPSPEATEALLRQRRTIHEFRPDAVPEEVITRALELAVWAPNHGLTEPWRFYRPGPETIEAIARLNQQIVTENKGAEAGEAKYQRWTGMPGWLVVTRMRSDDPVVSREDDQSCACAVHNLSLYLWSHGIGIKWATGKVIRHPDFCDLIWVDPDVEEPVAIVWYGYPAEVPDTRRTPADRFVVDLG